MVGSTQPSLGKLWAYDWRSERILCAGVTVCRPVPKVGFRSSDLISFSSPGTEKGFKTVIPSKVSP